MPLHLLGFSPSAGVCGVSGVEWVVLGEIAAAVLPLPPSPSPLEHAAHLAAIHRHSDVLPMRFGAVLPDAGAVGHFVRREQEKLMEQLDRLQGTAEIGVRITFFPTPAPPASLEPIGSCYQEDSPAQYLARRRTQYDSQDQLALRAQTSAEHCTSMLKGHWRDWRRLSPEPPGAVRLAFLVERCLSETFAESLATLSVERLGEHYKLLGPWPPYSFV